jgi:hypothetical protein
MQRQPIGKSISAVASLSAIGAVLGASPAYSGPDYAAREAGEVAFVEDLSGRVVGFSQGKPFLLETLDTIRDRTQLDLLARSELRLCHYKMNQVLTLSGPLRASISRDGVTLENGKAAIVVAGSCSAPVTSKFRGGLVEQGVGAIPVNDVLRHQSSLGDVDRNGAIVHGGAPGSGGPKGSNGNYKNGLFTAGTIVSRRWLRQQISEVRALTKRLRRP